MKVKRIAESTDDIRKGNIPGIKQKFKVDWLEGSRDQIGGAHALGPFLKIPRNTRKWCVVEELFHARIYLDKSVLRVERQAAAAELKLLKKADGTRLLTDLQINEAAEEIAIKQWLLDNPDQLAELYDGAKLAPYDVDLLRNQISILRRYGKSIDGLY